MKLNQTVLLAAILTCSLAAADAQKDIKYAAMWNVEGFMKNCGGRIGSGTIDGDHELYTLCADHVGAVHEAWEVGHMLGAEAVIFGGHAPDDPKKALAELPDERFALLTKASHDRSACIPEDDKFNYDRQLRVVLAYIATQREKLGGLVEWAPMVNVIQMALAERFPCDKRK